MQRARDTGHTSEIRKFSKLHFGTGKTLLISSLVYYNYSAC